MNRHDFIRVAGLGGLAVGMPQLGWGGEPEPGIATKGSIRPNILFIMTDQQFADAMSCRMGKQYLRTPAMDSLAERGTLFSRAYTANPLCMPARGSIFTGRYPHETGITRNVRLKLDTRDFVCMGTYFRQAGYATAYFGKWHLSYDTKDVDAHGFETFGDTEPEGKNDKKTSQAAVKWLSGKHDKPFLAVASFLQPHDICFVTKLSDAPPPDNYPPTPPNLAKVVNETDTMTVLQEAASLEKNMFPLGDFTPNKWRHLRKRYYQMIEEVDAMIGQVLAALKAAGLEENTVVIFTSDHGECAGAHGWNRKYVFYEESVRVPLIVCQKGVTTRGSVCDKLVNTGTDILPTMMDFTGIKKPDKLTGLSLKPIALGNQPVKWRDNVVVQNSIGHTSKIIASGQPVVGRMVRTDRYKYCLYDTGERREALFDMQADPLETTSLAGLAEHKQDILACRHILAEFAKQHNDTEAVEMLANNVPPRPFDKQRLDALRRISADRAAGAVK